MSKTDRAWPSSYSWAVLAILAVLFLGTSFGPPISDWTEGLYAGTAREMHFHGNWLDPTINGFPRIQKPPLVYWILVASTSIFGQNEFGYRFPVSLAISCWVGLIFLITRRLGGERVGIAAALILSTMVGVRAFAEMLQPEAFLALFTTGALWCLLEARFALLLPDTGRSNSHHASKWYWLFWAFLALGSLSKGIHGAIWPLGGVGLTALFFPATRSWLRGTASFIGIGIFLLIVLPWYIYMSFRWPGFLVEHFWNEQVRTAASVRFPFGNLQVPFSSFLFHQLIATLPWSMALPGTAWIAFKGTSQLRGPGTDGVSLLAMTFLWEAVSLCFSSRFTYYGVSTWGLAACFLAVPWRDDLAWSRWVPRTLLLLPGLIVLGAAVAYLRMSVNYAAHPPAVPTSGILESKLMSLFVYSPKFFSSPALLTAGVGAFLLVGGAVTVWFWFKNRPFSMLLATSISMLAPLLLANFAFEKIAPFFSLAPAAEIVNQQIASKTNPLVVWDGTPEGGSSLFVYLNARVHYVHAHFDLQYAQRILGLGRDFYLEENDFVRVWHSSQPVYMVLTTSNWEYWQQNGLLKDRLRKIYEAGNYIVVTNS